MYTYTYTYIYIPAPTDAKPDILNMENLQKCSIETDNFSMYWNLNYYYQQLILIMNRYCNEIVWDLQYNKYESLYL